MPYITNNNKEKLKSSDFKFETPGELNYFISTVAMKFILDKGECYQTYNDVIGALECLKMELYRRKVSVYEDKKIKENGDVF